MVVVAPGGAEGGKAEKEGGHSEAVAARGERIGKDVATVGAEVADDLAAFGEGGSPLGRQEGFFVNHDHLAEDAEASVHATFFCEEFELSTLGGVAGGGPGEKAIAHLVGEGDKVELGRGKALLGDGAGIMVIVVGLLGRNGYFGALKDEAIGSADILVKFALGKTNGIEKVARIKFAPSGDRKALLAEHAGEAGGGGEKLGLFSGRNRIGEIVSATKFELSMLIEVWKGF